MYASFNLCCFVSEKLLQQVNTTGAWYEELLQTIRESDDFITYSTLTVIYRAETFSNPMMQVTPKCYEAAKLSLQANLASYHHANEHPAGLKDYVNW